MPRTIAPRSIAPAGSSDTGVASSSSGSSQDIGLTRDRSVFWQWLRVRSQLCESPLRTVWTAADLKNYLKKQKQKRYRCCRWTTRWRCQ